MTPRPRDLAPRRFLQLALLAAPLSACANACARPTPEPTPPLVEQATAPGATQPPAPDSELDFADALRARRYAQVAASIDAARAEERALPEVRYARAVVAFELGDAATTLRSLEGLERLYPPFADEVRLLRLAAVRRSHDLTLLEAFLGESEQPEDLLALAEAAEFQGRAGEAERYARRALTRLGAVAKERRAPLELDAHALLARLTRRAEQKTQAILEYTWLATEAPLADAASQADEELEALGVKLTSSQRWARALAFSGKGWVTRTERELTLAKKAPGPPLTEARVAGLIAHAHYNAREDYEMAARAFARAAALPSDDRREYEFYEARALSRAQRDAEALVKYRALAARGGSYGEQAAYQVARLSMLEGDLRGAVAAFEAYGRTYPRGRYRKSWRTELSIARLCLGQYERAERELRALFELEKDDFERARLLELIGVAAEGAGHPERAAAEFRRVIELRPLSYPALLAAARLRRLGLPAPPPLLPAPTGPLPTPLVVELPDEVQRLHRVGLDEVAEDALRAEEKQLRVTYGARADEALCRLYGLLDTARRRYQIAQTAVSWSVLRRAPAPGTEWQVDCIYPRPYAALVSAAARERGLSTAFVYGVMRQESAFRPSVVSPANAVGLLQIIPPTAARIAAELGTSYEPSAMSSPTINVAFGTYYLQKLLGFFAGRLELAAAAYNAGPRAVTRWLEKGEGLPLDLFVARIPYEETRTYVYRVLGNTARYAHAEGGVAALPIVELDIPAGLRAPADAY